MNEDIDNFSFINNFSKWIKEENINKKLEFIKKLTSEFFINFKNFNSQKEINFIEEKQKEIENKIKNSIKNASDVALNKLSSVNSKISIAKQKASALAGEINILQTKESFIPTLMFTIVIRRHQGIIRVCRIYIFVLEHS